MEKKITNILKRQFGRDWESKALGGTVGELMALIQEGREETIENIFLNSDELDNCKSKSDMFYLAKRKILNELKNKS